MRVGRFSSHTSYWVNTLPSSRHSHLSDDHQLPSGQVEPWKGCTTITLPQP